MSTGSSWVRSMAGAPLVGGESGLVAVADLQRVQVVPAAGARVLLPVGGRGEAGRDVGPVGERIAAAVGARAAVALDVALGAPTVRQGTPGGGVGDGEIVGEGVVDRTARRPQRFVPGPYVGDVLAADAVDLEIVDAPRSELPGPGVDEFLGARLRVVDVVHVLAVVVLLQRRGVRDVRRVVRRALDRGVLQDGVLGDARGDVEAELQALGVDVVRQRLDSGGEFGGVDGPAAVGVDDEAVRVALLVEVVEVDVHEAVPVEAAGDQGVRLRLDLVLGRPAAHEAPAAPAHRGPDGPTIAGRGGGRGGQQRDGSGDQHAREGEEYGSEVSHHLATPGAGVAYDVPIHASSIRSRL